MINLEDLRKTCLYSIKQHDDSQKWYEKCLEIINSSKTFSEVETKIRAEGEKEEWLQTNQRLQKRNIGIIDEDEEIEELYK